MHYVTDSNEEELSARHKSQPHGALLCSQLGMCVWHVRSCSRKKASNAGRAALHDHSAIASVSVTVHPANRRKQTGAEVVKRCHDNSSLKEAKGAMHIGSLGLQS